MDEREFEGGIIMREYLKDFEDGTLAILVKKSDFGEFLAFMEDKCGYDFDNARKDYLDCFTGLYKIYVDVFAYTSRYSKPNRIMFVHTCSRDQILSPDSGERPKVEFVD